MSKMFMIRKPVIKHLQQSRGDKNINVIEIGNTPYKIVKKIGQGKFGDVYKAIDLKVNQERAIKMIEIN